MPCCCVRRGSSASTSTSSTRLKDVAMIATCFISFVAAFAVAMTTIAHGGAKNLAASVSILGSIILVPPVLVSLCLSRLASKHQDGTQDEEDAAAGAAVELEHQAQQQLRFLHFQEFATQDVAVNRHELQEGRRWNFHGCLRFGVDGMQEVSIRKLDLAKPLEALSHEEVAEIRREAAIIGSLRRCYLLPLLGFSFTQSCLLLFTPKMTTLTDVLANSVLGWRCRCRVAALVARGLSTLHYPGDGSREAVPPALLHGNIRSENVYLLLDEASDESASPTCSPYIAGTGLLKLASMPVFHPDEAVTSSSQGYAAPEVSAGGALTMKSDVYSFGVVLFVLLSGRADVAALNPVALLKKKLTRLMDPKLEKCYNTSEARTIQQAALKCLERDPMQRPDMVRVDALLRPLLLHT